MSTPAWSAPFMDNEPLTKTIRVLQFWLAASVEQRAFETKAAHDAGLSHSDCYDRVNDRLARICPALNNTEAARLIGAVTHAFQGHTAPLEVINLLQAAWFSARQVAPKAEPEVLDPAELAKLVKQIPDGVAPIVHELAAMNEFESKGFLQFSKVSDQTVRKYKDLLVRLGVMVVKDGQERNNLMRGPMAVPVSEALEPFRLGSV